MNTPPEKFNDDLLLNTRDRDLAAAIFGDILYVIDFPELRELFSAYDVPANRAKKYRRSVGMLAIAFGVIALLGASAALLHDKDQTEWPRQLAGFCAAMGVVSLLLGSIGTLAGRSKRRWLCGRVMTERLRQFHFQTLVCRLEEIVASARDASARQKYLEARRGWLAAYRLAYEGHLPARLRETLDDEAEENVWLHPALRHESRIDPANPALRSVFAAYRLLRFEHQIQYANFRLGADEGVFSSSATRQLAVLRNVALLFILIIFISNLSLAAVLGFGALFGAASAGAAAAQTGILSSAHVHVVILWLFVGIVAMRTLEEGLQPAREVERYTHYRSCMLSLLKRFDAAAEPQEKLAIMREAERASYQEMRGFLRTHNDASYIL